MNVCPIKKFKCLTRQAVLTALHFCYFCGFVFLLVLCLSSCVRQDCARKDTLFSPFSIISDQNIFDYKCFSLSMFYKFAYSAIPCCVIYYTDIGYSCLTQEDKHSCLGCKICVCLRQILLHFYSASLILRMTQRLASLTLAVAMVFKYTCVVE